MAVMTSSSHVDRWILPQGGAAGKTMGRHSERVVIPSERQRFLDFAPSALRSE